MFEAVDAVTATRSRLAKIEALAELLSALDPDEFAPAVGLLTASPRQGRIGVGWRGIATLEVEHARRAHPDDRRRRCRASRRWPRHPARDPPPLARATLQALAAQATGPEWDFLARVIVGELRTGALEGVLLDAIVRASGREAASVRRAAMLSGDLAETAALAITGTAEALDAVGLVVGRAIMPMLAGTAPSAAEAIATVGEASVEYKLDGARIQVHRAGDDVWVFTRNLADITHRLPEVVEIVRRMPVQRGDPRRRDARAR